MNCKGELSQHYQQLLDGSYECADRIVINGYYIPGHTGGGFRNFYRTLKGSDDGFDNARLMRIGSHPPFPVGIFLNGHEWVERVAKNKNLNIKKESYAPQPSPKINKIPMHHFD